MSDDGNRSTVVPLMRPRLPTADQVLPRLRSIDASGWYSNFGPQVRSLEARLAELLGVPAETVITAASATRGLEGALAISGTHRWEVPAWTFAATVGAALGAGKQLRFVDVEEHSWWLESSAPARIVVAPFGSWRDDVILSCDEVVVDAAASLGAMPRLSGIGPRVTVVFSLGATKVLGSGEGGFAVFGSAERAEQFREWTRHGFRDDRIAYTIGSNAKLSEHAAAYAHTALDLWGQERAEWDRARGLARDVEHATGLTSHPGVAAHPNPYWIVMFPDRGTRDLAERTLAAHGVETRRWWADGCHRMPGFEAVERGDLPRSDRAAETSLALPMFREIGEIEAHRIADALRQTRLLAGTW